MKAPGVRQSMAWIHGWLGLIAGWILFAMFLTGTASYFRPEITRWMQPELRLSQVEPVVAAETAIAHLQKIAPDAEQWYIYLPDDRTPITRIFIRDRPDRAPRATPRPEMNLAPATGEEVLARDTRGGEHFYRFHFQLQLPYPWGRWLAGLCAISMLAAILSGVITHKRIFVDFFTLRWNKGQRSWLDAHNVSAVLALPYHAMISYTGLITLVVMYMPWPVVANYAKPAVFAAEAYGSEDDAEATGKAVPLVPIRPLIAQVARTWRGDAPGTIVIRNPNDAAAIVTVMRSTAGALNARAPSMTFSGADGHLLATSPEPGAALSTAGVMLGLHIGQYAGPVLRWTCFLLGLTGAAMVGTGLILWTAKRKKPGAKPFFGMMLVEQLNIGAIACLPAGMAAFLLANRLLPAAMPGRANLEVSAMFWVWFGLAALACLRPVRRAWTETLAIAACAFVAIPVVNAATTDRGLFRSIMDGDMLFVAFDGATILLALLLGFAAWRASIRAPAPGRMGKARAPTAATAAKACVDVA